jgi:predicted PurR-regulated permease PerM
MLERLSRTRRNLVLLALGVLTAWFAWTVRGVLNPLLAGYLLAFILLPLVSAVERRGHSRRAAVNLIFVAGFVLSTLVLAVLCWQLRALALDVLANAKQVASAAPGEGTPLHESLQHRADEFAATLNEWGLKVEPWQVPDLEGLRTQAKRFLELHGEEIGRSGLEMSGVALEYLAAFVGGAFSVLSLFLLVPLYTYYFLFVIGDVHDAIRRYLPRGERARLERVFERIGVVIASFFRGRLSVAFGKGLFLALALTGLDMPYGFLIGMVSGALSIIPFVGAFTGFVLALVVGLLDHGVIGSFWRTVLIFLTGEGIENYVLVPRILGDRLGLHPLLVFFPLLAGGAALGMLGLLIALPLTATLVILFQEFVAPALQQFADETG